MTYKSQLNLDGRHGLTQQDFYNQNHIFMQIWVNYKDVLPPPTNTQAPYVLNSHVRYDKKQQDITEIDMNSYNPNHFLFRRIRKNREETILMLFLKCKDIIDFEHDVVYGNPDYTGQEIYERWLNEQYHNFHVEKQSINEHIESPRNEVFGPFPAANIVGNNQKFRHAWDISTEEAADEIKRPNYGRVGYALEILFKSRIFRVTNLMNDMFVNGIPRDGNTNIYLSNMDKYLIVQNYLSNIGHTLINITGTSDGRKH